MKYELDRRELNRQIMTLLSYVGVGPLAASAIAINLAMSEVQIRMSLDELESGGKIARYDDGRYYRSAALPPLTMGLVDPCLQPPSRKAG